MLSRLDMYLFPLPGGEERLGGTFDLDLSTGVMEWSKGLFAIHGFVEGEVVPTVGLLMVHKHPDDQERIQQIITGIIRTGGQAVVFHRLIDVRGKHHQVLSSFHGVTGSTGAVEHLQGSMVDLTRSMHEETRQAVEDALHGAFAHKAVIEQAKGIIMALLGVDSDAAFGLLSAHSQRTNMKLRAVAAALVGAATRGDAAATVADMQSLPLHDERIIKQSGLRRTVG